MVDEEEFSLANNDPNFITSRNGINGAAFFEQKKKEASGGAGNSHSSGSIYELAVWFSQNEVRCWYFT